jgi:hypothetical protein
MPDLTSPEIMELLERRLADSVGDRVEKALKYRYAAIVAAALGVLSLSGWSLIDNVVAKAVGPLLVDAQRNIAQMNLQLELAKDQKVRLDDMLEQIEVRAGEGQKRLEGLSRKIAETQSLFDRTLADLQDQFGTVVVRRRELEADLELNRRLIGERLGMIQQDVAALAAATGSLAQITAARTGAETDAVAAEAARIGAESSAGLDDRVKAVVFLQYGSDTDQAAIEQLAAALRKSGYVLPRAERMPIQAREVRYFWPEDAEEARALAVATRKDLRRQGLGDVEVQVKDFTEYAKAKPRPGTVELWLALPAKRS